MADLNQLPTLNQPRRRLQPGQRQDEPQTQGQPMQGPPGQPQQQMAPHQQPTFSQMQAQGQARPAPPTVIYNGQPVPRNVTPPQGHVQQGGVPQFNAPQSQYGGHLSQSIMGALQTPSAYGTEAVQNTYNRLGQNIDDQFTQRERATDERFAQRGLYDSTANAGAMHDLNVGRRTAHAELAGQLGDRQAQDYASARSAAIGQGLQGQAQDYSQGLGSFQANLGAQGQHFSQDQQQQQQSLSEALGYGNLNLGQQQLTQQGQLANRGLDQQGQLANRGYDINEQQGNNQNVIQLLNLLAALGINPQGG